MQPSGEYPPTYDEWRDRALFAEANVAFLKAVMGGIADIFENAVKEPLEGEKR